MGFPPASPKKKFGHPLVQWTSNLIFGTECFYRFDIKTRSAMQRRWTEFLPYAFWGAVCFGILGFGIYFLQAQTDDAHVEKAALAVSVLPPDTENAWISYVDRRVAASIIRKGDIVQIVEINNIGSIATTFVSLKTPYQVSCDDFSGAVAGFGPGDDSVGDDAEDINTLSTTIFWPFGSNTDNPYAETPPPLNVDAGSVAANKLLMVLCQRVLVDVRKIMANSPPTTGDAAPSSNLDEQATTPPDSGDQ